MKHSIRPLGPITLVLLILALSGCGGAETTARIATEAPLAPPSPLPTAPSQPTLAPAPLPPTASLTSMPQLTVVPAQPAPTALPQVTATPIPAVPSEAASSAPCLPAGVALPPAPAPPAAAAPDDKQQVASAPPVSSYQVVRAYPHDRGAFTEGLVYEDGVLYEGTGGQGQSMLRRVDLATGAVTQSCALPAEFFGEGVTIFGDKIIQLTWRTHVGFVYDKASFAFLRAFSYPSEGWGLTHDQNRLIMSDGTATLHFLDPATLEESGQIAVYDDQGPVLRLNELEYVGDEIYANVWQTDRIARISPQTGQVLGWIDLSGLLGAEDSDQPVAELNGIAYDAASDRLFVTGKLWPKLFEIKIT